MSLSLREQLLAAGLATEKQVKQVEQQQRKQNWRNPQGQAEAEQKRAAQQAQAQAAKAARDQELNRKRKEEAERRDRWAQIKQLVAQHAIARPESEEGFNFIDRGKVRRIFANAELRERIISGALAIIRCEGRYHLVPAEIGARIGEREANAVVQLQQSAEKTSAAAADDPYKDFVVPDDLKW
jgi:uncharacterized protein YaiL (DUF2058 family)